MEIVFVHGWSVRSTATYGHLPERLAQETGLKVNHIYLGKYVSFDDAVTLDDLAQAFDAAIREQAIREMVCITHSTGGPLVRHWLSRYAGKGHALRKLIMLAPANHGSALAQLGKGRLGRIKAFFESIEPGQKILDWLELGSEEQWELNKQWLTFDALAHGCFPFVLAGETIDRKFYDHLNSYTGEPGGDGVVRVAAANLNFEYVRLEQGKGGELAAVRWQRSPQCALRVVPNAAHGGEELGILRGIPASGEHPSYTAILEALAVHTEQDYVNLLAQWASQNQARAPHSMVVFRVKDDTGRLVEDYDLLLTAGEAASPDDLPKGFFRDRQRNKLHPGKLTYFLDHTKLAELPIGFVVQARPEKGLVSYSPAAIAPAQLAGVLRSDETLMVDIQLRRTIDRACFQLTKNRLPEEIRRDPLGQPVCKAA
ncbi:MAG: hypothetical protein NW208_10830 [Bryobacter sp.]|nr:hypothetical protein [Bryobacter sp.]